MTAIPLKKLTKHNAWMLQFISIICEGAPEDSRWARTCTRLPVKVEVYMKSSRKGGVCSHFAFSRKVNAGGLRALSWSARLKRQTPGPGQNDNDRDAFFFDSPKSLPVTQCSLA